MRHIYSICIFRRINAAVPFFFTKGIKAVPMHMVNLGLLHLCQFLTVNSGKGLYFVLDVTLHWLIGSSLWRHEVIWHTITFRKAHATLIIQCTLQLRYISSSNVLIVKENFKMKGS